MTTFEKVMAHARRTQALSQVMGRLGWDQETMMPRGAAGQRAEEMAAMEAVLHARRSDPRLGEWLALAQAPDAAGQAQLRLIRREHERTIKVPERLASALARAASLSQGAWAEARARDDVAMFLPHLREMLALRREEAAAIAEGGDPYDALLDDYEPGITGAEVAKLFDALRPRLRALRDRVLGASTPAPLRGEFDPDTQLALARDLARRFGYDFARGRLDLAVHPFSSGGGADARITTRIERSDPFNCLYSTIHETGHATYEQGVDPAHALTPVGQGVSMGVHESQSRILENQLGRSRPFTGWLFSAMREAFGPLSTPDADAFHAAVNRVQPGFIRTESDELHYNLHIMLRFDLERDMIAGRLAPEDLEDAWNHRFEADFGVAVDRPAHGMLQDVHWSIGLFGYFPTYALGNVYAGCLDAALSADTPGLEASLEQGDPSPATAWLRWNVQRHGGLYEPRVLIESATGAAVGEGPLLDYLERKFTALYDL